MALLFIGQTARKHGIDRSRTLRGRAFSRVAILVLLCMIVQPWRGEAQSQSTPENQAEYATAESLLRNRHWNEALETLGHLLKLDPGNLKALNLAGIACSGEGDSVQADRYFEQALKVDPRFVPALKNLSISEFNARDYAAAERHFLAAQRERPDDPVFSVYLGEIAFAEENYSLAASRLAGADQLVRGQPRLSALLAVSLLRSSQKQQALDLLKQSGPDGLDPESQRMVGVALAQVDANEEAVPYLAAAFRHDPDSYGIGFDLALSCVRAKQYAAAAVTIQTLIDRAHDSSELENLLAEASAGEGNTEGALKAYRHAIALDPSDENNYVDFSSFCIDHHAFAEGMMAIGLGLQAHPDSARLIYMRGVIEAIQENFDLAEKDFRQAAQLNPQHDLGTIGLGAVYLERGDSAQALTLTRAQLKQTPDDPNLLYLLGESLLQSGAAPGQPAFKEAQQSLEKSVHLNAALCLPHISLGSVYMREGRYADAAVQYEAARSIDPSENSAYSHLAMAYRHLGQAEKERTVLKALQALLEQERSGSQNRANAPDKTAQ